MKKLMFALTAAAMLFAAGVYAEGKVDLKKADKDGDGKVTIVEYIAVYKVSEDAAKAMDKNGNGVIEEDEVGAPKAEE